MTAAASGLPKGWRASPAMRLVLKFAITLGLLGLLASKVNLRAVAERIGSIGWLSWAVCILVTLALSMLVALRWQMILARMRNPIAFAESWRLVLIGLFFNQILPSGLGGDAVRVWLLMQGGSRLRAAFLSVAADRIFALSAVILCMAGFLPLLVKGPAGAPVILLTLAGALGIAALLGLDRLLGWMIRVLPRRLYRTGEKFSRRGINALRDLAAVLRLLLRSWPEGAAVIGISVVNQLVLGGIVYFIAWRLHAEIGLVRVIALFSPALLLSMLPISLGGWGVREAALVWLLGTAGVPADTALAISLLFGLVATAAGLPGGVLWLFERRNSSAWMPAETPPAAAGPAVLKRGLTVVSPWVSLMARTIDFGGGRVEVYHAIEQADYIAILAVTPDFRIPIVRQYRPALERHTWELPAGMVDAGEAPADTCARELREETGLVATRIHPLGVHAADSARLGNRIHSFLAETAAAATAAAPEPGIQVEFVTLEQMRAMILSGEFDLQFHIATVALALMRPEFTSLLTSPDAVSERGGDGS